MAVLLRTRCWWERGVGVRYASRGAIIEVDAAAATFLLAEGSLAFDTISGNPAKNFSLDCFVASSSQ